MRCESDPKKLVKSFEQAIIACMELYEYSVFPGISWLSCGLPYYLGGFKEFFY